MKSGDLYLHLRVLPSGFGGKAFLKRNVIVGEKNGILVAFNLYGAAFPIGSPPDANPMPPQRKRFFLLNAWKRKDRDAFFSAALLQAFKGLPIHDEHLLSEASKLGEIPMEALYGGKGAMRKWMEEKRQPESMVVVKDWISKNRPVFGYLSPFAAEFVKKHYPSQRPFRTDYITNVSPAALFERSDFRKSLRQEWHSDGLLRTILQNDELRQAFHADMLAEGF